MLADHHGIEVLVLLEALGRQELVQQGLVLQAVSFVVDPFEVDPFEVDPLEVVQQELGIAEVVQQVLVPLVDLAQQARADP